MKTAKQMERHFKGAANHCRIEILLLVSEYPDMTVEGITETLKRILRPFPSIRGGWRTQDW